MKSKHIFFTLLLVFVIMISGTVSAVQDNSTDVDLMAEENEYLTLESVDDEYVLGEGDNGTSLPTVDPSMNVTASDVTYGEDVVIEVYLPEDATGYITTNVNEVNYEESILNGKVNFSISGLDAGNYFTTIFYSGDAKYNPSSTNITISIAKANPEIIITAPSEFYISEYLTIFITSTIYEGNITVRIGENNLLV